MKQSLILLAATATLLALLSAPAAAAVQSNVPQDIKKYADTEGIASAKESMMSDPTGYGFANIEELQNATVGLGFEVHHINPDTLQASNGQSLKSIITPSQEWDFLITSGGQAKTFFTVKRMDGKLQVVGGGGKTTDFQQALNTYDSYTSKPPILIKNGLTRYLLSDANNQEVVIPAVSGIQAQKIGNMSSNKTWDVSKFIHTLQQIQEQSKQAEGQMGGGIQMGGVSSQDSNPGYGMAVAAGALALAGIGVYAFRKKATK